MRGPAHRLRPHKLPLFRALLGRYADEIIAAQQGGQRFVTSVVGRLDTATGLLEYLIAGHHPPLLIRDGRVVKELTGSPRLPLGLTTDTGTGDGVSSVVRREQLEPGDRLLLYSDGITEARNHAGEFFGARRLVEFTERAQAARLSAPETLRRLLQSILHHQAGRLQDDATLLMIDWSTRGHRQLFPTPS